MSRTRHHSIKHGPDHRFARRPDRGYGFGRRGVGEAPGWHVRLFDTRPARRADHMLAVAVLRGERDADGVLWNASPNRKPHSYYW